MANWKKTNDFIWLMKYGRYEWENQKALHQKEVDQDGNVRWEEIPMTENLDENQVGQYGLLEDMQRRLDTLKELDLIEKLKPKFSKDGNQFCYLYGDNLQVGIAGFGNTVAKAMNDFYKNFYTNN